MMAKGIKLRHMVHIFGQCELLFSGQSQEGGNALLMDTCTLMRRCSSSASRGNVVTWDYYSPESG